MNIYHSPFENSWSQNVKSLIAGNNQGIGWYQGGSTEDQKKLDMAQSVGNSLTKAQQNLMSAFEGKNPDGTTLRDEDKEAAVQKAQIMFQKATRIFQIFSQVMDAAHQIMMKQIERIRA